MGARQNRPLPSRREQWNIPNEADYGKYQKAIKDFTVLEKVKTSAALGFRDAYILHRTLLHTS